MKYIYKYKILLIFTIGLLIISCDDFLNVTPETELTKSRFFQSQLDFEQAVNAIYSPLHQWLEGGTVFQDGGEINLIGMRSDDSYFEFDPALRGVQPQEDIAMFTLEVNNPTVEGKWINNYTIISRANDVIYNIDLVDFDSAVKENLRGQALFLRAFAYFDLVRNFGGVPLHLEPTLDYESSFKERASLVQVYDQIISDAQVASEILPSRENQQLGRATSGAAKALLGDVFITLERWSDAEEVLTDITEMGYDLLPDYLDVFKPTNKGNSEIIFDIQFQEGTSQNLFSSFPYRFLPAVNSRTEITGITPDGQNGDGKMITPTPEFLNSYDDKDNDQRYEYTISYFTGESMIGGIIYEDFPYVSKFLHDHGRAPETSQNWPIYRYAEVLLLLAESLNEQGNTTDALFYLNQVRNRAGLSDITNGVNQNDLRNIILNEQRIELAFENKRWHYLVRHGQLAVSVMNEFGENVVSNPQNYFYPPGNQPPSAAFNISTDDLLFPIPITEIERNPWIIQNPGY
jgi:starch-binding outer membrane protein, SusD/RagB family